MILKRSFSILLVFCMLLTFFPETVFTAQAELLPFETNELNGMIFTDDYLIAASSQDAEVDEVDEYQRASYTLNEIRVMLQQGDAIGYKRVYRPNAGPSTYEIPAEDLVEIFGEPIAANNIQALNNFTYNVRTIWGEGRDCSESIVLVLLGDGFTAGNEYGQVGDYRNPGEGTFLYSAHEFAETLTSMYPFSLFSDVFKIYAVETPSAQQGIRVGTFESPIDAPYPGTYLGTYLEVPWFLGMTRSQHALDISEWVSTNAIMTQVIANTRVGGGVAYWTPANYENRNSVGISTRFTDTFILGWSRPAYHSIVVHEIGHNFGLLVDEHAYGFGSPNTAHANMARATDTNEQLKWGHWYGHAGITRRTVDAPAGYIFPSTNWTCKMQGWEATLCAVCRAELTRRMAMISGETFEAGRRPNGTVRPPTNSVEVTSPNNRILPYAFNGNVSLETITIPASVNSIGDFAFIGTTSLRTILNLSITPQLINDTTFAGVARSAVEVHIPAGTTQAFIAAGWEGFMLLEVGNNPVTDIAIQTQPTTLTYTAGQTLNLAGLVVTLTYEDSTTHEVAFADFDVNGLTANPAEGTMMEVYAHDGQPVTISHVDGPIANTDNLAVDPIPEPPTPTPEPPTPTPEPPTPTPEPPTPTPEPPTPTPEPPTPTPEPPTPTPEPPTPTPEPPTPTPEPPTPSRQWELRPRIRTSPAQPPTNLSPTPTTSPTPDIEPASAIIVSVPVQASSFTTVNEFRQVAPSLADELFEIGLLVGIGIDAAGSPIFELNRPLNRMEAIALVIRLMGLEERALGYIGANTFSDTPDWGSRIAAFAYNEGIAAGIGGGLFAADRLVTYQEFTVFLLRALGYSEVNGDFLFEHALDKAVDIGLYSENQRNIQESSDQFLRYDAVLNMVNALLTNSKDTNSILLDTLVANNVIGRQVAVLFFADIGNIIRF